MSFPSFLGEGDVRRVSGSAGGRLRCRLLDRNDEIKWSIAFAPTMWWHFSYHLSFNFNIFYKKNSLKKLFLPLKLFRTLRPRTFSLKKPWATKWLFFFHQRPSKSKFAFELKMKGEGGKKGGSRSTEKTPILKLFYAFCDIFTFLSLCFLVYYFPSVLDSFLYKHPILIHLSLLYNVITP